MSDDTARIDRLEREVAELRSEVARIMRDTDWMRTAGTLTPAIGAYPGEPLDHMPIEFADEPFGFTKATRDGDPV